jgi:hypothetical protein
MAVRPPSDDDLDDEPDTVAFGIAALDARLAEADVDFPADSETVREAVGGAEVPYNAAGNTMTVAEALDRVPPREFETEQELLNVLHPVFEERREASGGGLLARIRAFIPL